MVVLDSYDAVGEAFQEKLQDSTFLVTGATGMIGQNFLNLLIHINDVYKTGMHILACARDEEKARTVLGDKLSRSDIDLELCDVTELDICKPVDYIVHTASITGGSKQHLDFPMRTISVALEGTKRVLDIALERKSKGVVFLSSLEVYGNTGTEKSYIYETDGGYIDPTNPRSSYSESKRMCECMFAAYAKQYGVPAVIARLTASFGNGVSYKDNRVFAQFAKSVLECKDIVLNSTGGTVRNYCDVEDVATALLVLLMNGVPGEAYNVANMDTKISIKNLALKFIDLYQGSNSTLRFDCREDVTKLGYNKEMRNVLNSEKLMKLGWRPQYGIEDMIRHLVESMEKTKGV